MIENTIFEQDRINHFRPEKFSDIKEIIDCLITFKEVTVNLEELNSNDYKRVVDALWGALYALKGNAKKITKNIYKFNL